MPKHSGHPRLISLLALFLGTIACNFPALAASATPTQSASRITPNPIIPTPLGSASVMPGSTPFQPSSPKPAPSEPPPISTVPYQPSFEPAPCAFPVPGGYGPQCGNLVVPENRTRPDSPMIRLHVAIFPSQSNIPAADPVVHLAGGPGSSSLDAASYMFQQGLDAILERRNFILVDQRGTGHTQPRLDCPEREALTPILLDRELSAEEEGLAIAEAFRQCRDRLRAEGIDFSAYNSAASAADVNDLRLALGYAQINLYAVSYGTRLALTIMRDFPEALRSAVLDSVYPPQVHLYTSLAPNAHRAFNVLFEGCASDRDCNQAYPDLRDAFYTLVDRLNANPIEVSLTTGRIARRVQVDGDLLIDVLFVGLYNRLVAASMPKMIFDINQGDYTILRQRLGLYFETSTASGMQMAVQCAEEIPFSPPEEAFTLAQGVQPQLAAFFPKRVEPLFTLCQELRSTPPDQRENQPVASDVPSLVLAGEYDPITPPEWGRMAASTLRNAFFFEFPGNGHWVTRSSSCARAMALDFWEEPAEAPDSACMESMGGLDFVQ